MYKNWDQVILTIISANFIVVVIIIIIIIIISFAKYIQ